MDILIGNEQDASVPEVRAKGLLFVADPHVADHPPNDRVGNYRKQILAKVRFCLRTARKHHLIPIFLGDLLHVPVDNSSSLLEELTTMFKAHVPWVLVGNHDKHLGARTVTPDVSLMHLHTRGAIHLIGQPGPVFRLVTGGQRLVLGASPDGYALPSSVKGPKDTMVMWISHHNVAFPDFRDKPVPLVEIPGVHWVVNGHIHRPQPSVTKGMTCWANPGNITRLSLTPHTRVRKPAATIWRPGYRDLERVIIPHLPIGTIFPEAREE
ncbi:metallophosphoesterase [Desulfoplanes formicivorans]|uniref:Metallophosphoesterase n=1 Tax=Desulfoplanes formicivorans TaxID=1592317 RepID=A0A194AEV5_9BACT|nr:metallophosphoesterase [Desulfoplanes formicivorans]GAU07725.1 metallophosphoesterase [Desulfoplanes formicivorans]